MTHDLPKTLWGHPVVVETGATMTAKELAAARRAVPPVIFSSFAVCSEMIKLREREAARRRELDEQLSECVELGNRLDVSVFSGC